MWKFRTAWDSDGHPLLHSLNGNVGRQVWVYDPEAGTPEERARAEELRRKFAENRLQQKHSADELLRWAMALRDGRCRGLLPPTRRHPLATRRGAWRRQIAPAVLTIHCGPLRAGCRARGSDAAGLSQWTSRG